MERTDYESSDAFRSKIWQLAELASSRIGPSVPSLVVFPEAIGSYLSFLPRFWDDISSETRLSDGIKKVVETHASSLPSLGQDQRRVAQQLLFMETAVETEAVFTDVFSGLARDLGAYVIAGSLYLPRLEHSPHRGGAYVADDSKLLNQSFMFSPHGLRIGRTAKVNIPPGEDDLVDPARTSDVVPVQTALGRIGTLICYDGYHDSLVEMHDQLGTGILAQPSYFSAPEIRFDGSGEVIPGYQDFIMMIQGRENVRFGVGAFMVGEVFGDKRAEGLSFIARNTGSTGAHWVDAVISHVEEPFEEGVAAAMVDL